ncbi:MAG: 7-carboxy-7-deazaguanine synthase QueE [Polyangiaceae bacterium]
MAELRVSEIFESLQGEGVSAGTPCTFLRLATCNLRCSWCDTKYTWDFKNHDYDKEVTHQAVRDVATRLGALAQRRLVVTGGEPLLQASALEALLDELTGFTVEVETNGTLAPSAGLAKRVDQWNVSPKLANADEPRERRVVLDALRQFRDLPQAWLKLVLRTSACVSEALQLVDELDWPRERVIFMPEANDLEQLERRAPEIANASRQYGVRFSSRLHLALWNGRRGT